MILEEVMSQSVVNTNIDTNTLLREHNTLILEHNELLSEMADMFVAMLNEECIFTESVFDDLKVKKEDLADPNKVKAIIKRIELERIAPTKKDMLLGALYGLLLLIVGIAPGTIIYVIGEVLSIEFVSVLGGLLALIGTVISVVAGGDVGSLSSYRDKTQKAIKKVDKAISEEKDPKMKKHFKKQKEALQKNLKLFEKADYKNRKAEEDLRNEIRKNTQINHNFNYDYSY